MDEDQNETWEQSQTKVSDYLSNELDMNETGIKSKWLIDSSKSKPRPIIVKFSYFKDKDAVLRKYHVKRKERE